MRTVPPVRSAELNDGRRWGGIVLLLFAVALLLRLAPLLELSDLPTFRRLVMDAARYDGLARDILAGSWLPAEPFYQAPLYPYFLACIYAVFGVSYTAVRWVQALLGAATVALLALGTGRVLGRPAGLATGVLAAFYGPLVLYAGLLLKPTLGVFFLTLLVVLLFEGVRRGEDDRDDRSGESVKSRAVWLAAGPPLLAGIALGGAVLLRGNHLVLLPVLAGWLLVRRWVHLRTLRWAALDWRSGGLFVLGVVLPLLPVVWANHHAGGGWQLTSGQGGMSFYIGNVPGSSGVYRPLSRGGHQPERQKADAQRLAARWLEQREGRAVAPEELSSGEVSRILWRAAWREIVRAPGGWLRLLARKAWWFWNAYEVPDAEGLVVYRELSAFLGLAPVGFGWLTPLAVLGLLPAFRRSPRAAALLLLGTAAVFVSVVLFFVFGRYRLPVVVFLLPLAGTGAAWLVTLARCRRWRALGAAVVLLAVTAVVVNTPAVGESERQRQVSALWFNLGSAADRLAAEAYRELPRAEAPAELLERGLVRSAQGVAFLDRAVEAHPNLAVGWVELGVAWHRRAVLLEVAGRPEEALAAYGRAVESLETGLASPREWMPPELPAQAVEVLAAVRANRSRLEAARAGEPARGERPPRHDGQGAGPP